MRLVKYRITTQITGYVPQAKHACLSDYTPPKVFTVRRETLAVGKFGKFTTKTHLAKENLANFPFFEVRVKIFTT